MQGLQNLIRSIEEMAYEPEATLPASELDLLLYSPCPVKLLVKAAVDRIAEQSKARGRTLGIHIPMGCTSIDPYDPVCDETDPDKLPSVIASIGFGDFWKTEFADRFVKTGLFEAVLPEEIHPLHRRAGLVDPNGHYTLYGVTPYIFLVDLKRLGDRPVPRVWSDLFSPEYKGEIVMCGDGDDMADAVLLNLYREHGRDGMKKLAANVGAILHSAQMAQAAGTNDPNARAIFLIPYFFAVGTKQPDHVRMIWPEDGAAASPLYFLAKKSERTALADLVRFFTRGFAAIDSAATFLPVGGTLPDDLPPDATLKWIGWDFIDTHDVNRLRNQLNDEFREMQRAAL